MAKSTTNGELHDVRIDNTTLYLEYSGDSIIDVAKITDRAGNLGLTQGSIEYGRDIIRIGKSEVEIVTQNGIRNYTDLADDSNIVLTFYTSLGELEVGLYFDEEDENLIIVEINDEDLLEEIESYNEEIEQNCLLGGLPVIDTINQGFFVRSGGLMRPEVISGSNKKWVEREDLRRISDSREKISR